MAKKKIDLNPQILNLTLYSGDGPSFKVIIKDTLGSPVPLTGDMKAQVRVERDDEDPPSAEFSVDLSESEDGIVTFSLTGVQTQELSSGVKFVGVWDLEWEPTDEEPVTLLQGVLECFPDVTH